MNGQTHDRTIIEDRHGNPVNLTVTDGFAILSTVSEDTLEETLAAIRRARAFAAVSELQRRSLEMGTYAITPEEIDAEIAAVRRARKQRRAAGE